MRIFAFIDESRSRAAVFGSDNWEKRMKQLLWFAGTGTSYGWVAETRNAALKEVEVKGRGLTRYQAQLHLELAGLILESSVIKQLDLKMADTTLQYQEAAIEHNSLNLTPEQLNTVRINLDRLHLAVLQAREAEAEVELEAAFEKLERLRAGQAAGR